MIPVSKPSARHHQCERSKSRAVRTLKGSKRNAETEEKDTFVLPQRSDWDALNNDRCTSLSDHLVEIEEWREDSWRKAAGRVTRRQEQNI